MTLNFKKIFARKAKEIAAQVDEGQRLLDDAQDKISLLKKSSKSAILKDEIIDIVLYRFVTLEDRPRFICLFNSHLDELCELAERGERS